MRVAFNEKTRTLDDWLIFSADLRRFDPLTSREQNR
jgi:hypothetical protein